MVAGQEDAGVEDESPLAASRGGREEGTSVLLIALIDIAAGVAVTCEWLAGATVRSETGAWYPALSPVTERTNRAYEELIEAEYLEAQKLDMRRPRPMQHHCST